MKTIRAVAGILSMWAIGPLASRSQSMSAAAFRGPVVQVVRRRTSAMVKTVLRAGRRFLPDIPSISFSMKVISKFGAAAEAAAVEPARRSLAAEVRQAAAAVGLALILAQEVPASAVLQMAIQEHQRAAERAVQITTRAAPAEIQDKVARQAAVGLVITLPAQAAQQAVQ